MWSGASKQHKGWILFPRSSQTGQRRLVLLGNILLNEFIALVTICLSLPILILPSCPACVTQTCCNLDGHHADLPACCSVLISNVVTGAPALQQRLVNINHNHGQIHSFMACCGVLKSPTRPEPFILSLNDTEHQRNLLQNKHRPRSFCCHYAGMT